MNEEFRTISSLHQARNDRFIENLLATIRIQQDLIVKLEDEIRKLKCLN